MVVRILFGKLLVGLFATPSFAADFDSRLNAMEETLKNQQKTTEEQQQIIDQLKAEFSAIRPILLYNDWRIL